MSRDLNVNSLSDLRESIFDDKLQCQVQVISQVN